MRYGTAKALFDFILRMPVISIVLPWSIILLNLLFDYVQLFSCISKIGKILPFSEDAK